MGICIISNQMPYKVITLLHWLVSIFEQTEATMCTRSRLFQCFKPLQNLFKVSFLTPQDFVGDILNGVERFLHFCRQLSPHPWEPLLCLSAIQTASKCCECGVVASYSLYQKVQMVSGWPSPKNQHRQKKPS